MEGTEQRSDMLSHLPFKGLSMLSASQLITTQVA